MATDAQPAWQPLSIPTNGPRKVRATLSTKLSLVLIFILAVAIAVGLPILFARRIEILQALQKRGVTTQGRLDEKYISSGKSTTYHMTISYETRNGPQTGPQAVDQSFYNSYRVGDSVPITFLPDKPDVFVTDTVTDERIDRTRSSAVFGTVAMLVTILVTFFGVLAVFLTQRKVMATYIAVPARLGSDEPKSPRSQQVRIVKLSYLSPTGQTVSGSTELQTYQLKKIDRNGQEIALINPASPQKIQMAKMFTMAEFDTSS